MITKCNQNKLCKIDVIQKIRNQNRVEKRTRKSNSGFTLIELLAVIVILAVIALIATPLIMNVIKDSKDGAFKEDGNAIIEAANLYAFTNKIKEPTLLDLSDQETRKALGIKTASIKGDVTLAQSQVSSVYITNGEYCITGNYRKSFYNKCSDVETTEPEVSVTTKTNGNATKIIIDTYDKSDVAYIELPNGKIVDTASTLVNGKDATLKVAVINGKMQYQLDAVNEETMPPITAKFSNVDLYAPESTSLEKIIRNQYDVVIDNGFAWIVFSNNNNALYKAGINIFTGGNDNVGHLDIIDSASHITDSYTANRIKDNEVTSSYIETIDTTHDSQFIIRFQPEVEVWYQSTYNGETYDALGYLINDAGTRWFHSQISLRHSLKFNSETYRRMIYRLSGKKSATYTVDKPGRYKFKVVDIYNNIKEVDVTI